MLYNYTCTLAVYKYGKCIANMYMYVYVYRRRVSGKYDLAGFSVQPANLHVRVQCRSLKEHNTIHIFMYMYMCL